MALHFIIDGYNALHSTRRWEDLSREAKRLAFLRYLDENRPTGSDRNSVTVVFDGYAASLRGVRLSLIQLVFSGEREADTEIKERVVALKHPADAVVVTDDRGLRAGVKASGARVMSCDDFFNLKKSKLDRRAAEKPGASSSESINRELKRVWKLE